LSYFINFTASVLLDLLYLLGIFESQSNKQDKKHQSDQRIGHFGEKQWKEL